MPLMTQVDYAARRGCSKQNIGKLVAAGKITLVEQADGRRLIDSDAADAALAGNLDPTMGGNRAAPAAPSGSLIDAKTTVTEYAAKTAALNWARESGLVVDAQSVESEQHSIARKLRDRMLRIDREVAEEVAACADPRECRAIVRRAIEKALVDVADLLSEPDLDMAAE